MKHDLDFGQDLPDHLRDILISDEDRYGFFQYMENQKATLYAAFRQTEYPPITDFVDAWVKNDEVALEEYRQKCLEVKLKYPKPEL